jgi:hypothetical protein
MLNLFSNQKFAGRGSRHLRPLSFLPNRPRSIPLRQIRSSRITTSHILPFPRMPASSGAAAPPTRPLPPMPMAMRLPSPAIRAVRSLKPCDQETERNQRPANRILLLSRQSILFPFPEWTCRWTKNQMLPGGIGAQDICCSQVLQGYCPITALDCIPLDELNSIYCMHVHYTIFEILVKYFFPVFPKKTSDPLNDVGFVKLFTNYCRKSY